MIHGEENKQFCTNCGDGPLRVGQDVYDDFFDITHCSEECAQRYKKKREKEYDAFVDPLGFYQAKARSKYD